MHCKLTFWSLFFIIASSVTTKLNAQNCIEIERILVDACAPSDDEEGLNEMLLFRTGDFPVNSAHLQIDWATALQFNGIIQNDTTQDITAQLNETIFACGFLVEPVDSIIPPHSKVILITSYLVSVNDNPFSNLTDTLYVIYHHHPGPTGGHFRNYSFDLPIEQTTTIYDPENDCTESVTYIKTDLVDQSGGSSAQNGATVVFNDAGEPAYINNGCSAPISQFSAAWTSPGVICQNVTLNLNNYITGTPGGTWSGEGVTDSTFSAAGLTGAVQITYTVAPPVVCEALEAAVVTNVITVIAPPDPAWTNPGTVCFNAGLIDLSGLVTGTPDGTWSGPGVTGNNFDPQSVSDQVSLTYSVGSGNCTATQTQNLVVSDEQITAEITVTGGTSLCPGLPVILSSNAADFNEWTGGSTENTLEVMAAGTYVLTREGLCNTATDEVVITGLPVQAVFTTDQDSGYATLPVLFATASVNAEECIWFMNDSVFDFPSTSIINFTEPGEYLVKLKCSNSSGCLDSTSKMIKVMSDQLSLEVPNVFSPNGDFVNDFFQVNYNAVKTFNAMVYNWRGKLLFEWNNVATGWDGSFNGEKATDGVYFYVINGNRY